VSSCSFETLNRQSDCLNLIAHIILSIGKFQPLPGAIEAMAKACKVSLWARKISWPAWHCRFWRRERFDYRQEQFRRDRESMDIAVRFDWAIGVTLLNATFLNYHFISLHLNGVNWLVAIGTVALLAWYGPDVLRLRFWRVRQKLTYKWVQRMGGRQSLSAARRDAGRLSALIAVREGKARVHRLSDESLWDRQSLEDEDRVSRFPGKIHHRGL
jgi:hypothetical protein